MVDTARQASVQALRARFAQKEKVVIDALKAQKDISKVDVQPNSIEINENETQSNGFVSTETGESSGSSSPSLSQKPNVGPKPILSKKLPTETRSASPSGFKDLVAHLQKQDGMYMSQSALNSNNNNLLANSDLKILSDVCDNKSTECNPTQAVLIKNAKFNQGTQAVLIKKETIFMGDLVSEIKTANTASKDEQTPKTNNSPKFLHTQSTSWLKSHITKGNKLGKFFYRKKKLPSIEVLGPPPTKTQKPPLKLSLAPPLPQRNENQVTLRENDRLKTSEEEPPPPLPIRVSLISLGNDQSLVPPPRPCVPLPTTKSPPNRLPPLPPVPVSTALVDEGISDELYGDTVEPERVQSLLSEYTEEEECGGKRSRPSSYIPPIRPKNPPPPPPPPSSSSSSAISEPVFEDKITRVLLAENYTSDPLEPDEEIYEEMPNDERPGPVYSNTKDSEKQKREEQKRLKREQKEKEKHGKLVEKLRKKYGLTGEEIPVDAGVVKTDSKGNKTDLTVHKGETVLILRMENNPVGKWLAKNEKGKIGYVELTNIEVDPDSVKSVMTVRVSQTIEEAIYSDIQSEDIYECAY